MNLPLLLTVHFIFKKVLILYSLERSSLVILISFQRLCILFPSLFQGYIVKGDPPFLDSSVRHTRNSKTRETREGNSLSLEFSVKLSSSDKVVTKCNVSIFVFSFSLSMKMILLIPLFDGTFVWLPQKYHQLRIKILGDCYYCISGAPEERPDHAVLCVHMGLSMVEAIKSVREKTKSPVDMRVGVHTGGVLAGVMGQRQWQFDVYSKDVELANKMESGGLPGMVHISETTLSFLDGEFEVKDGDGASREEAIRLAGVKTYLIVKVLKEVCHDTSALLIILVHFFRET